MSSTELTDRICFGLTESQRVQLRQLLEKIATAYPDDPGTSDLYDEQHVSVSLDLGDVRLARQLTR